MNVEREPSPTRDLSGPHPDGTTVQTAERTVDAAGDIDEVAGSEAADTGQLSVNGPGEGERPTVRDGGDAEAPGIARDGDTGELSGGATENGPATTKASNTTRAGQVPGCGDSIPNSEAYQVPTC
jgi:hypothetical protein